VLINQELKLPFRDPIEVFRCDTCGGLVVGSDNSLRCHAGHYLKQPCRISLFEYLQLLLGIIR